MPLTRELDDLDRRLELAFEVLASLARADRGTGELAVAACPAMGGEVVVGLFSFLDDVVEGRLPAEVRRREAAIWREVVGRRWVAGHRSTEIVGAVLDAVVDLVDDTTSAATPEMSEGRLEEAARCTRRDPGRRPDLWRALHRDGVWVAIVDREITKDGLALRLVTSTTAGARVVLGFSTEHRLLETLVDCGTGEVTACHLRGEELRSVWPAGHHLVLDGGTAHTVVLDPAEMTGLPSGPVMAFPPVDRLDLRPPRSDDWRRPRLARLIGRIDGLRAVTWCRLGERDLLVLEIDAGHDPAAISSRVAGLAPFSGFGDSFTMIGRPDDPVTVAAGEAGCRIGGEVRASARDGAH